MSALHVNQMAFWPPIELIWTNLYDRIVTLHVYVLNINSQHFPRDSWDFKGQLVRNHLVD